MSQRSVINNYLNDTDLFLGSTPNPTKPINNINGWAYNGNIVGEQLIVQLYDGTDETATKSQLGFVGVKMIFFDTTQAKNPTLVLETAPEGDGNDASPGNYRSRWTYSFAAHQFHPHEEVILYFNGYSPAFDDLRRFLGAPSTAGPAESDEVVLEIRLETPNTVAACDLILTDAYIYSQAFGSTGFQRHISYDSYANDNPLIYGLDPNAEVQPIHVDVDGDLQVDVLSAPWSHVDDAAFTIATDEIAVIGGIFNDVAPDSVDEGDAGGVRMSANRNMYSQIRDAAGNERGVNVTASNEMNVLETNSAAILADTDAIQTAVEIIDNMVYTAGIDTYLEATSAGALMLGVRNDGNITLANTDNELVPMSFDSSGNLYITGSVVADTELPSAQALTDDMANPTAPAVASHAMVWDGATWDRAPGTSVDGLLVNLGSNNDVVQATHDNLNVNATMQIKDVDLSFGQTTMAISLPVVIASDQTAVPASQSGTWNINDISGTVSLPTGASTEATLAIVETNTDSLTVIGGGVEATALRVTLANDSSGVLSVDDNGSSLTVDNAGTFAVQVDAVPTVGTEANMWSAASPGAGGDSTAIDTQYAKAIDIFGNVSGACVLTVYVSQDNATFYKSSWTYTAAGSEDFYIPMGNTGARYIRLKIDTGALTITATCAAKQ